MVDVSKGGRAMTLEQNITAILESYFIGFKAELIEACTQRIMEQIERQADTPQTETQIETQNSNLTFEKQTDEEYINNLPWTEKDCPWK